MYLNLLDKYEKELGGIGRKQHAALFEFVLWLEKKAAQQSVQSDVTTRCPKCGAVTGWHHEACPDYEPESSRR